jgi:magnesium transporter
MRIFLSNLINADIFSENREPIGRLSDLLIRANDLTPKVLAILAVKDKVQFSIPWECVAAVEKGAFHLANTILRPYRDEETNILLAHDVLDKQIVDRQGMKVVRVNDLILTLVNGVLMVTAVDVGVQGIARRLYLSRLLDGVGRLMGRPLQTREIPWEVVETLGTKADPMKLKVTVSHLKDLHPADLADIVEGLDREERNALFSALDDEKAADTLMEVEESDLQVEILSNLETGKASDIVEEMDPDDAADILGDLSKERQTEILQAMDQEEADDVRELLQYPEDSAGGLMTTEYIALLETLTAEKAIEELRQKAPEAETIYYLYVTDDQEHLRGVLSLRQLIIAPKDALVGSLLKKNPVSVQLLEKEDKVAEMIDRYGLLALPVVDGEDRLQGIVTVDDIMDGLMEDKSRKRRMVG